MRRRELHNLRAGNTFTLLDNGPMTHLMLDTSAIPLQPDRVPGVYTVRLADGLAQWQAPGLVVYTESQYDVAKRIGIAGEGSGINWHWFYFASWAQANELVQWCDANDVEHRGVSYPTTPEGATDETKRFFGVRVR